MTCRDRELHVRGQEMAEPGGGAPLYVHASVCVWARKGGGRGRGRGLPTMIEVVRLAE